MPLYVALAVATVPACKSWLRTMVMAPASSDSFSRIQDPVWQKQAARNTLSKKKKLWHLNQNEEVGFTAASDVRQPPKNSSEPFSG